MSAEYEFQRVLSDMYLPMSRYVASIEGKRDAFTWEAHDMDMLARERDLLEGNYRGAVRYALANSLQVLPEGSTIVDWGIGDGYHYPLDTSLEHLHVIGIDPQADAFYKGVAEGRIPNDAVLIKRDGPPYDELEEGNVAAVIAISAFHILNEPRLMEVVQDLRFRMAEGGFICLLQDITPGPDFLIGVTDERLERMTEYFMHKYNYLQLKPGSIRNRGGFWGDYMNKVADDVTMGQGVDCAVDRSGRVHTGSATNMPFFPDISVWDNMSRVLNALANHRHYSDGVRSVSDIEQYLKPQGRPELYRILLATNRLTHLVSESAEDIAEDSALRTWSIALMQVVSFLSQDVYEAYLMTIMEDSGIYAEADRVGVVSRFDSAPYGRATKTYMIDGSTSVSPDESGRAEVVATVRRVRIW